MLMLRHMHMTHFGHHVIIVVWQETWNGRIWFLPLADFYCSTQKTTRLPPRKDKNCGSNGNPFLSDTKVGHTALVHFLKTLKREFSACVVNAKQNAAMRRACCPFRSFHNSLAIYTIYIYILYIYIYYIYICICDCFDCHRQEDDQADLDACLEAGFSFGTAGFAKLWICPACAQHHSIAS